MADSAIGSLPAVQLMQAADLFVLEQNGEAMKLSGELLSSFIDRQITSVTVVERAATDTYTASYNSDTGALTLGIPRGVGIASISDPTVSGLNKTYTITWEKPYSAQSPTTKQFTVKDGNAITGISAVSAPHTHGALDHYRVSFSEGDPFDFYIYNGEDGDGSPGNMTPKMDGTATVGTEVRYARQDHVHPTDTSRQKKMIEVTVNVSASASSAQIGSLTDSNINANTKLVRAEIANPKAQMDDWTVNTNNSSPQLTITGTCAEATTVKMILADI